MMNRDERGHGAVEYMLLVGLISVVGIAAVVGHNGRTQEDSPQKPESSYIYGDPILSRGESAVPIRPCGGRSHSGEGTRSLAGLDFSYIDGSTECEGSWDLLLASNCTELSEFRPDSDDSLGYIIADIRKWMTKEEKAAADALGATHFSRYVNGLQFGYVPMSEQKKRMSDFLDTDAAKALAESVREVCPPAKKSD